MGSASWTECKRTSVQCPGRVSQHVRRYVRTQDCNPNLYLIICDVSTCSIR